MAQVIPPVTNGSINLAALPALLQTQSPTIFEVGCHNGYHTSQFLRLFHAGRVFAFEPDERAQQAFRRNVNDSRAVLFHVAIGSQDGFVPFYPSSGHNPDFSDHSGVDWDHSGSIRKPTGHLLEHPWCSFADVRTVRMKTLDTAVAELGIECIDFLWADVQGAEADLIRGAATALSRTRYIHTEYSNVELYEGQPGLVALLEMLPQFRVLIRWGQDILLWNTQHSPPPASLIEVPGPAAPRTAPSTSLPSGPYVLARPCTGMNDTLCELEKCLRYCEASDRHLIIDTTRSGLFENLDVYLEPRTAQPMTLRCDPSLLRHLNTLASKPTVIAGRIDSYDSHYASDIGAFVESGTLEPITFDFSTSHAEPLLVHEQPWSGPLLSPSFLARCRFTAAVAEEISRRLATIPQKDYIALHIRNTDYTTVYPAFFERIRPEIAGRPVLVCTDDSRVFHHAVAAFPQSSVFRLSSFVNDRGEALHCRPRDNQHELNLQMWTDLMGLALAQRVLSTNVEQLSRLSGFTLLALALHDNKTIALNLLN